MIIGYYGIEVVRHLLSIGYNHRWCKVMFFLGMYLKCVVTP